MQRITSREHPYIKYLVKLQKSARLREQSSSTVLDGIHLIQSYLAADTDLTAPKSIIVSETGQKNSDILSLVNTCRQFPETVTRVFRVTDHVFEKISPVRTPTGILACISVPAITNQPGSSVSKSASCILLESIQDPGNLGAIIRTAAAADISDIFLSKDCTDAWSPKTLRAAMGAHFFTTIHNNCNLIEIAGSFHGQVLAASPKGSQTLYQSDLNKPTAFIFGNEGAGLSKPMLQAADRAIAIPMPGQTESLNAAAAAAVFLFEKVRQQWQAHHMNTQFQGSENI
ncbi:RNA methyltransferase, TrmH family [Nitrosomonas sp. Nm51]|uniref:TrmH family RNA methyltransferase n=1 Tax=Nitrosomonas sp. Nm51 TaxID=133720 RepID=UPI0008D8AE74|nr:RNA methyltransferase [Nitrosomonas sp. Nm51]SEQ75388.1 RNA methyltransferase, TrmH family [Nitrosomonas sp. Nm51]